MSELKQNSPNEATSKLPLEQHRMRGGVTLEQVAEETKISLRFLRAIESEHFDDLPGGLFTTSYIRQYACAIGFDEEALLDRYHAAENQQGLSIPLSELRPPVNPKSRRHNPLSWFRVLSPIRFF